MKVLSNDLFLPIPLDEKRGGGCALDGKRGGKV